MTFTNANSFKAKIKAIAQQKGVPAQQIQQNYLIEQVLRLIAKSPYQHQFIVKGGYLIGHLFGLEKRTTMDLDVTLKGAPLTEEYLSEVFGNILSQEQDGFQFELDKLQPIRKSDDYGGYSVRLIATFDMLREVVFIDITTGDKITPREIEYRLLSSFSGDAIHVFTYNLETILAEKLETIISRGEGSTRPRDRYDLYTLYYIRQDDIDYNVLKKALENTSRKRGSQEQLANWERQVNTIQSSTYQRDLWANYQKNFKYAQEISFDNSVAIVSEIMSVLSEEK